MWAKIATDGSIKAKEFHAVGVEKAETERAMMEKEGQETR